MTKTQIIAAFREMTPEELADIVLELKRAPAPLALAEKPVPVPVPVPAKAARTVLEPLPDLADGEEPIADHYRVKTIREDVCVGRRFKIGTTELKDSRWTPAVYREIQCEATCQKDSDLCMTCARREEKYVVLPDPKIGWLGRVTEEPLGWSHMLGTEWAESAKPSFNASAVSSASSVISAPSVPSVPSSRSRISVEEKERRAAVKEEEKRQKAEARAAEKARKDAEKAEEKKRKDAEKAEEKKKKEAEKARLAEEKAAEKARNLAEKEAKKAAPKAPAAPKVAPAPAAPVLVSAPLPAVEVKVETSAPAADVEYSIITLGDGISYALKGQNVYEFDPFVENGSRGKYMGRLSADGSSFDAELPELL